MRTHRFTGATSREVLKKVKLMLGDDAMILSNRNVDGGIEVVAVSGDAIEERAEPVRASRAAPAQRRPALEESAQPKRPAFDEDMEDDGYVDGLSLSRAEP